ncbi:hypothetical protein GCK72_004326 [Caenorhabditis remanei]|uniref:DUF38 domain-containing protein n=1 Tax=Caenorhabditis remanei TaxID=31234 RepID=A0A6A5HBJ3_CAERE|nr:hypothetical protein GCK72_004326 [Caenorhabditis remanei]KAF1764379.1 hypothetical protein GCK72_004326 [Caenorhabditis remanei]
MPMNIEKLAIYVDWGVTIKFSDPIVEKNGITAYAHWPCRSQYTLEGSAKSMSEAVNDIGIVFSNPNLKITRLELNRGSTTTYKQNQNEINLFQEKFVQCLVSMMSSLPHQIHVEYVFLDCIEILPFLKSEKLKMIDLSPMEITDDSLHKIAQLEQIKRLPIIRILPMLDHVPFDIISNTSKFGIFVRNFPESDFTRFVEQNLQEENFKFGQVIIDGNGIGSWITDFLSKHHAVKTDDGSMIATLDGPKFKNTVEFGEIEGQETVVFKRTT